LTAPLGAAGISCLALTANFDILSVAENIGYDIVSALALIILVWFRNGIFLRLGMAFRWISSVLTKRRFVLIWIDDDQGRAGNLARLLEGQEHGGLSFHVVKRPRSLLFYPLSRRRTAAVILLDTDVSKLADEPKVARKIEDRLQAFVEGGGGLIGGHDLIYRRARHEVLQSVFGCQTDNFLGYKGGSVPYRLNPEKTDHALAVDLPTHYTLNDGEICWGKWASDVVIVFTTDDDHERPLVTCRKYSKGRVVWLNSGDRGDTLCASIAKPEDRFVVLLRNALRWVQAPA
jgi:hypothetical protein